MVLFEKRQNERVLSPKKTKGKKAGNRYILFRRKGGESQNQRLLCITPPPAELGRKRKRKLRVTSLSGRSGMREEKRGIINAS